jgi:hypothetical protein
MSWLVLLPGSKHLHVCIGEIRKGLADTKHLSEDET